MIFYRIRALREDNDYTQTQIAKILHVNQRTYSRYENGDRSIPIEVLIMLANFYGVTIDYLVGRVDSPKGAPLAKKYAEINYPQVKVADKK